MQEETLHFLPNNVKLPHSSYLEEFYAKTKCWIPVCHITLSIILKTGTSFQTQCVHVCSHACVLHFSSSLSLALRPTQIPIQRVPCTLSLEIKLMHEADIRFEVFMVMKIQAASACFYETLVSYHTTHYSVRTQKTT
jgi:hypothetical protein